LFLLFFRQIIAVDISFSVEILGRRGFGERKNSGGVRCSFAVPRCSGWKNPKTKKGTTAGDVPLRRRPPSVGRFDVA
ncbi:MAG TPA: hypothetical protein VN831_07445, partial [Bradyrhizobium sp.]|nr:hypothetical protein [Bradyrhizobium sp.]